MVDGDQGARGSPPRNPGKNNWLPRVACRFAAVTVELLANVRGPASRAALAAPLSVSPSAALGAFPAFLRICTALGNDFNGWVDAISQNVPPAAPEMISRAAPIAILGHRFGIRLLVWSHRANRMWISAIGFHADGSESGAMW